MAVWTSNVSHSTSSGTTGKVTITGNTTNAVGPGMYTNIPPNQWQGGSYVPQYPNMLPSNPPQYPPGQTVPNVFVSTPTQPLDGMVALIKGKYYRYSAALNEWHELVDGSTTEQVEVPVLPIELDTSGMLNALRQYRDFLDDLDGLSQDYADAVDDTLFGLCEAIRALERIEHK